MMPLDYPTDREMLEAALPTIGLVEPERARLLWIHNTLDLREVECSASTSNRPASAAIWRFSASRAPCPSMPREICPPLACGHWRANRAAR